MISGPADRRLQAEVGKLVAQCRADSERRTRAPTGPWDKDPLICTPAELRTVAWSLVGVQAQIADAQRKRDRFAEWLPVVAIAVGVIGALPFLWYFLLRRIRELREAIIGR